jgi:hypothetical protein
MFVPLDVMKDKGGLAAARQQIDSRLKVKPVEEPG